MGYLSLQGVNSVLFDAPFFQADKGAIGEHARHQQYQRDGNRPLAHEATRIFVSMSR